MRVVGITRALDEADVIEAFVRRNALTNPGYFLRSDEYMAFKRETEAASLIDDAILYSGNTPQPMTKPCERCAA